MEKIDLRKLSIPEQEAVRVKVLKALDNGMRKKDAMSSFGISDAVIYKWLKVRSVRKENWFRQEKRGRPSQISLTKEQEKQVKEIINNNTPDEFMRHHRLWSRKAVCYLVYDQFDMHFSLKTIGRYLRKWGYTPSSLIDKAREKKNNRLEKWIKRELPGIKLSAKNWDFEFNDAIGVKWMQFYKNIEAVWSTQRCIRFVDRTDKWASVSLFYSYTKQGELQFLPFKGELSLSDFDRYISKLKVNEWDRDFR